MLERWLAKPLETRRASVISLLAVLLGLLAVIIAAVWLALLGLWWLFTTCCAPSAV